jgi:hypothetical protein
VERGIELGKSEVEPCLILHVQWQFYSIEKTERGSKEWAGRWQEKRKKCAVHVKEEFGKCETRRGLDRSGHRLYFPLLQFALGV